MSKQTDSAIVTLRKPRSTESVTIEVPVYDGSLDNARVRFLMKEYKRKSFVFDKIEFTGNLKHVSFTSLTGKYKSASKEMFDYIKQQYNISEYDIEIDADYKPLSKSEKEHNKHVKKLEKLSYEQRLALIDQERKSST
jgi:hypothetical protein